MTIAAESRRQPVLASGPPAFPATGDYNRAGFQDLADSGFHRLFSRHGEELLFHELRRDLRRPERSSARNHLDSVNDNASTQAASLSAGYI
jgi:hypothetical protein